MPPRKAARKAAPKAAKASAPVKTALLNPDRDVRRRTRANPSPGLKTREGGIEKEPSFARKKATIARTSPQNAAAAAPNQDAEENNPLAHPSSSSTSRLSGGFIINDPSSHQAAGSPSLITRSSKRAHSEVSDDGSGSGQERLSKRVRSEDTPFEYFHPSSNTASNIQLNSAAIHTSPQNVALEDTPAVASTPTRNTEIIGEGLSEPFRSLFSNDVSTHNTPEATRAAQATQVAYEEVAENSEPEAGAGRAAQAVHEEVDEHSKPEAGAGDQSLAVAAAPLTQGPVNGTSSSPKLAAECSATSKKPLAEKFQEVETIQLIDGEEFELLPATSQERRFRQENTKRMVSNMIAERNGKEPIWVLRPDLQEKKDRMQNPRKKQFPTDIINIHVETRDGVEDLISAPLVKKCLLKLHLLLTEYPDALTPAEVVAAVRRAIKAKAAKLARESAQPATMGGHSLSKTFARSQAKAVAAAQSERNPNNNLAPIHEGDADNNGHIIGSDDDVFQDESEFVPESHTEKSQSNWPVFVMSAVKSAVSKPFEYFGGASHRAGPPSADYRFDSGSPSKMASTPTPAPRHRRKVLLLPKAKSPSALQKGKGKAPILPSREIDEFQAHAQHRKNKQRATAAAGTGDDELPHNTYNTQPVQKGESSKSAPAQPAKRVQLQYPKNYVPPIIPGFGYVTARTFNVPDGSDSSSDDGEEIAEERPHRPVTMTVTVAERQRLVEERAVIERVAEAERQRVEAERKEAERIKEERIFVDNIPDNFDHDFMLYTRSSQLRTHQKFYLLSRARLLEKGLSIDPLNRPAAKEKRLLAMWHTKMGTVGRFQLEEQAAKGAIEKQPAEKAAAVAEKAAAEKAAAVAEKAAAEEAAAVEEAAVKQKLADKEFSAQSFFDMARKEVAESDAGNALKETPTAQSFFDMARQEVAESGAGNTLKETPTAQSFFDMARQEVAESGAGNTLKEMPNNSNKLQEVSTPSQAIQPTTGDWLLDLATYPNENGQVVIGHLDWKCPAWILALPPKDCEGA